MSDLTIAELNRIRGIPKRTRYDHGEYITERVLQERDFNKLVNGAEILIRKQD